MRALGAIVIALLLAGASTPAAALEFCDKIKDLEKRLVCLQEHISVIEEKLLAMSTQITDLRNALKAKLDSEAVYKVQQVGVGTCLGVTTENEGKNKVVGLQSCNSPDSWKLLPGSQKPGPEAKKQQEKEQKDKDKAKEQAKEEKASDQKSKPKEKKVEDKAKSG